MPSATIHEQMPVPAAQVFNLLHDYSRRLEWDTLLCEARLTRGHTQAGPEATSLCVGRPWFGLIGIETRYIAFKPAEIAAVEMINHPPFFGSFAAPSAIRTTRTDRRSLTSSISLPDRAGYAGFFTRSCSGSFSGRRGGGFGRSRPSSPYLRGELTTKTEQSRCRRRSPLAIHRLHIRSS
jgi:hypothetical protein